jgi:ATP-dependent Lhr-like helicase
VTTLELAEQLVLSEREVAEILPALEAKGTIFRGHFTSAATMQWCDRYNLERIHRITLARVRAEVAPCSDQEYAAFRLRWMHIAGADLSADANGVAQVLEQLAGMPFAAEFWETSILPARVPGYRREMLDLVCLGGQTRWTAVPDEPGVREVPSRVTFVPRRWAVTLRPEISDPEDLRDRGVLAALRGSGAQYLDELSERVDLSERDTLASLWRLAALGLATNDSFAPLRLIAADRDAVDAIASAPRREFTKHDAMLRARLKSSVSGRWSALGALRKNTDEEVDLARELAMLLLNRNGILSREMLALESLQASWHELSFALRRLEYAGTIRRGWFVGSLSAEQYALPAAVEMLRAARNLISARERPLALSAADPANPFGALLPGCAVTRDAGNLVVVRAGTVVLGLSGRALLTAGEIDDESFSAAIAAILALRAKVVIDTIDGVPALASVRVGLLASMRFHSDGRALIYDGLPGPVPLRATLRA